MIMNLELIRNYARLITKIGVNIQDGQEVLINADVNDEYFVRLLTEEAYNLGAKYVSVDWSSANVSIIQYKNTNIERLSEVKNWQIEKLKTQCDVLPAVIYLRSTNPDMMKNVDGSKIISVRKSYGNIMKPIKDKMENKYQWNIACIPGLEWSKKVFPQLDNNNALEQMWKTILQCSRVNDNAIDNWTQHNNFLHDQCDKLNQLHIKRLVYKNSLGTDLSIGLSKGVLFCGGNQKTISGIEYNPNIPSEECYTSPNKDTAEGVVFASKPLSLQGKVFKDFGFRFEKGKIVEVFAKDQETKSFFEEYISIDEGASRLGEVALVPYDSPINKTNLLFYSTLYDENASCHIAIGLGFEDCIENFEKMTEQEKKQYNLNDSIIHTDFMIGTNDLSIKGILENDTEVEIFENGNWVL